MTKTLVLREAAGFSVSSLLELWKLDGTAVGLDTIYYFTNASSANFQPIVFNGVTYTPFPISLENNEVDGKGSLPRPKLTVSNIRGFVSSLLLANGSIDGATVTRTKVFARFIDVVNFPANEPTPSWVTPDPTATYAPELWQINRKVSENPQVVTWELASPHDAQRARLPKRTILAGVCADWKYRETGTCNHTGAPIADAANRLFTGSTYGMTLVNAGAYNPATTYDRGDYVTTYSTLPLLSSIPIVWVCTTDGTVGITPSSSAPEWVLDSCSKSAAACKMRFGSSPLRTSAYPGVSRAGFLGR
jgi:lambda family phage minor tail protein L